MLYLELYKKINQPLTNKIKNIFFYQYHIWISLLKERKTQGLQMVYECYNMDKMPSGIAEGGYDESCTRCEWCRCMGGFKAD